MFFCSACGSTSKPIQCGIMACPHAKENPILTDLQYEILVELTDAMSQDPTMSPHRAMSRAMELYRPNTTACNMGETLASLKHYNKVRKADADKYKKDFPRE